MRKTFIETGEFTEWVKEYLSDEALLDLQRLLLDGPETGAVIPGCGGLRKIRAPDPWRRKGKRGGARVIYLHVAEAAIIYLMDVFGKDEKEDLSAAQKKVLKKLAGEYKREAIQAARELKKGM